MTSASPQSPFGRGQRWRLGAVLLFAALNLRPTVASIGPVLDDIRTDAGLSAAAAAGLTALPLVCFSVGALLAPSIVRRLGSDLVLRLLLTTLVLGLALRWVPSTAALFTGTLMAGSAIAVGHVLIPTVIKRRFAHRLGVAMGGYVSATVGGAALAAGITAPMAGALGGDWRAALAAWAVPGAVALALSLGASTGEPSPPPVTGPPARAGQALLRDRLAWQVTAFMGLQSLVFQALLAWLPSVLRSHGLSAGAAGRTLSMMVLLGIPSALVLPPLLARSARQGGWALAAAAVTGAGLVGLLTAPAGAPTAWAVLLGIGTGVSFPLAQTLVVLRARRSDDAARLSAMSHSVGFAVSAAGPLLLGALRDVSGGWVLPLGLLIALLLPQSAAGLAAGRPRFVGDTGAARA